MTKEELVTLSDEKLLEIVKKAQGHTKDFSEYMKCDFSYALFTQELKRRGYENGWHKVNIDNDVTSIEVRPDIVKLSPVSVENTTRKTFIVSKSVADRWGKLSARLPYKTSATDAALNRFLDAYEAGHIKFELDV